MAICNILSNTYLLLNVLIMIIFLSLSLLPIFGALIVKWYRSKYKLKPELGPKWYLHIIPGYSFFILLTSTCENKKPNSWMKLFS